MAVAEHASTPAVARSATGTTGTTLASAAFSPPAGSLLVVAAQTLLRNSFTGSPTTTLSTTGTGITFTPLTFGQETRGSYAYGGIWVAYLSSAQTNVTVTMTRSESGAGAMQLAVRVLTGAAQTQTGATTSADTGGAYGRATITPTVAGSQLYVLTNADNSGAGPAALSGTTLVDSFNDTTDLMTGVFAKGSALTPNLAAQTVGVQWTAGTYDSLTQAVEIVPGSETATVTAAGVGSATVIATPPATANGVGTATVTGTDTVKPTVTAAAVGKAGVFQTWTATVAAAGAGAVSFLGAGAVINPRPTPPVVPPVITGDLFRASHQIFYSINATYNGQSVATDLRPIGGTITDTIKPGVRRTLQVDLAPEPGLFDKLTPYGTLLSVTANATNGSTTTSIPMGVFRIDSESVTTGGGRLSITAPDRWAQITQAKFMWPTGPQVGIKVTDQIVALIHDALGAKEPVLVTATSLMTVGPLAWQQDRAQAIIDLATSIGAWVFFDRNGNAVVADVPTIGAQATWLLDASSSGVMIGLDRKRDRSDTFNVVAVSSSAASGKKFDTQYVWDSDVNSPTYAGTNPPFATNVGPFGIAVFFHDDPSILDAGTAQNAGAAILATKVGLASQASITSVPNSNIDAFDVIDVMPPQEHSDVARVMERHVVDTVVHPLSPDQPQTITARSTRVTSY